MKFCKDHWTKLRAAIEARGLSHLVAQGGVEAAKRMTDVLDSGRSTKANFDPLLAAHNMLIANIMDLAGLEVMLPNEDGSDRCPLCFLVSVCKTPECPGGAGCKYQTWIDRAAEDSATEAQRLGLAGSA